MKFYSLFFALFLIASLSSCGGDDVDCSDPQNLTDQLNQDIQRVETALDAFIADPENTDKCNNYKDALNDLIDFSEDLLDCTDLNTAAIQSNIDISRQNLSNLTCN
jgi:hypothetical protein